MTNLFNSDNFRKAVEKEASLWSAEDADYDVNVVRVAESLLVDIFKEVLKYHSRQTIETMCESALDKATDA